jgi:hypothetical protein
MDRFRLQPGDHALDQPALAGGVPAVDADQHPAAAAQVMDLQVEQLLLELLQLVLVVVLVDRTVDHLDLVQLRPFAHRFLRSRIVTAAESGGNCASAGD